MQLIDMFPSWMVSGGIFSRLSNMPWSNDDKVSTAALDIEYFGNRSGFRSPSALVYKLVAPNHFNELSSESKDRLCDIIKSVYLDNWSRLWTAYKSEYDAIENYNMIQVETPDITRNVSTQATSTGSSHSSAAFATETQNELSKYGLGSVQPAKDSRNTETSAGSAEDNYSDSQASTSDNRLVQETESGTRQLTRHGNIGVTTSQQMLQSELDLWKWHYFETVFSDLDAILTCPYWRPSDV